MGLVQKSAGHRLQAQRYVKNAGIKTLHTCSYELHLSMFLFYTFLSASARHRIQTILTTNGQLKKFWQITKQLSVKKVLDTHWVET